MRSAILTTIFLMSILVAYTVPHFALAQKSETCDEDVCHVTITKEGFVPKTLIVKIGTKIIWTNMDERAHTVTSGSPGEIKPPLKSAILNKGDTYEFTFHHFGMYQGSYKYFDQITLTMRGEIIVEPEPEKEPEPKIQTIPLDFSDPESGVKEVSLSSGTISSMEISTESTSLIINVENVENRAFLTITLDRNLIDAKDNGQDASFIVLVDVEEGFYEEVSSTPTERTLEIVVPSGSAVVEIIGTQVIPEFPIVMLVIAGIFTALVTLSRFGRIRIQ